MAAIPREEFQNLVLEDVMQEATLQNISEQDRRKCIQMVLASTNPKQKEQFVTLSTLVKGLAEIRYGQNATKCEKEAITQSVLRALKCPNVNLQFGTDYLGAEIKEKKGKLSTERDRLKIKWEKVNALLISQYFAGDEAIECYKRCHERTFASFCQHVEANNFRVMQRSLLLNYSAMSRNQLQNTVVEVGINPHFGTLAALDKKILSALVPGKGTQLEKIARARNIPVFKGPSAIAELNPAGIAFRIMVMDTTNQRVSVDQEWQLNDDPVLRKRKLQETGDNIIAQTIEGVRYHGISEEENLRLRYSPAKEVQKNVQKRLL